MWGYARRGGSRKTNATILARHDTISLGYAMMKGRGEADALGCGLGAP
jgi:hypothetical protein